MNSRWITLLTISIALVASIVGYKIFVRDEVLDKEESDISSVLNSLARSQELSFKNDQTYTDEIGDFYFDQPNRPTIVATLPDCTSLNTEPTHIFLGQHDEAFKAKARAAIEGLQFKDKCLDLKSHFLAYAGQDLDGDADLEIWSIDEQGRKELVFAD